MKRLVTPEVVIDVCTNGDWVLRASNTGYFQLDKAQIDRLTGRTPSTRFESRPDGWQLMIETVDGPVMKSFATRREYREAKRGL